MLNKTLFYTMLGVKILFAGVTVYNGDYTLALWVGISAMWMINYLSVQMDYDKLLEKSMLLLKNVDKLLKDDE